MKYIIKQRLYQNKVNYSSQVSTCNCKMDYSHNLMRIRKKQQQQKASFFLFFYFISFFFFCYHYFNERPHENSSWNLHEEGKVWEAFSMTGEFDRLPFFSISHEAFTAQRLDK